MGQYVGWLWLASLLLPSPGQFQAYCCGRLTLTWPSQMLTPYAYPLPHRSGRAAQSLGPALGHPCLSSFAKAGPCRSFSRFLSAIRSRLWHRCPLVSYHHGMQHHRFRRPHLPRICASVLSIRMSRSKYYLCVPDVHHALQSSGWRKCLDKGCDPRTLQNNSYLLKFYLY